MGQKTVIAVNPQQSVQIIHPRLGAAPNDRTPIDF
jgi:hypothetical protein